MAEHFDFVVIGGGSAGYAAARTARESVDRVAIIDGASELGGLCILRGCMPSKTLIHSAEVLHHARHGERYGLRIPEAAADMRAVQERKRRKIKEFQDYRVGQLESDRFTLYRAKAHFVAADRVALDDGREITAEHFLIATGSVVNEPPVPGLAETPRVTSDEILELAELPESVLVLGGGVVACELAQYLRRMGARVIMVQRSSHILRETTLEAARVVEQAFRDEGIELYTDTHLLEVGKRGEWVFARFEQDGQEHIVRANLLFNALGRRPNTAGLGLEAAGVQIAPSGHIKTGDCQITTNSRIYAAGDVAGPFEIVHVALQQGEVAARHALGQDPETMNYDKLMSVVFTDPRVGIVGLTEVAARARGFDVLCAEFPFDDHGKSITMDATYGYVKLVADRKTCRLIGAEAVGHEASELIHAMTYPVATRADIADLLKADWYHPTLSEIWTYPIEDLAEELCAPEDV